MINITKGLDVPIAGSPSQSDIDEKKIKHIALLGRDYIGMLPSMLVNEGDTVQKGQILWKDKKNKDVCYTAPNSGVIKAINRGNKRCLNSLVIEIDETMEAKSFTTYSNADVENLSAATIKQQMNQAGIWNTLRTRPFSKVPQLDSTPNSIFVTAIDTHPLAANPEYIIRLEKEAFSFGLSVLNRLVADKLYVCVAANSSVPTDPGIKAEFSGPHPAGLVETHIAFLDPVSINKIAWHMGYQDVIALGKLFMHGELYNDRVISLAGPGVKNPRLIKTQIGVKLSELTENECKEGKMRVVSGSVLGGHTAQDDFDYLGRYHNQVSVLADEEERLFLGWVNPFVDRYSILNLLASKLCKNRKFNFSTTTNGSERAILPIGNYERVMPLDILATPLLRTIVTRDTDNAQKLGILELDEEDLALCTYVCAGKYEYAPLLRECLTLIEKEG